MFSISLFILDTFGQFLQPFVHIVNCLLVIANLNLIDFRFDSIDFLFRFIITDFWVLLNSLFRKLLHFHLNTIQFLISFLQLRISIIDFGDDFIINPAFLLAWLFILLSGWNILLVVKGVVAFDLVEASDLVVKLVDLQKHEICLSLELVGCVFSVLELELRTLVVHLYQRIRKTLVSCLDIINLEQKVVFELDPAICLLLVYRTHFILSCTFLVLTFSWKVFQSLFEEVKHVGDSRLFLLLNDRNLCLEWWHFKFFLVFLINYMKFNFFA